MREPKLIEVADVALDDIGVDNRLRPVSASAVAALVASIRQLGRMKDEIHIRRIRHQDNRLQLIAGGHRLAAARELGWETIRAKVWDCTDDWAALLEIDDNMAQSELSPLEMAVFFAARKRVYERMYPETKRGGIRGNQFTGGRQTELSSFCQATAEKRGVTERQVRKIVAVGEAITPAEVYTLSQAKRSPSLKDLIDIAGIPHHNKRIAVVDLFAAGKAKTAAAAIKSLSDVPPVLDPVDKAYLAILEAWKRAPKAAKRRLAQKIGAEVAELYTGEGEEE